MTTFRPRMTVEMQLRASASLRDTAGRRRMSSRPRLGLAHACRCRPIEASDLVQTLALSLLCSPAGWIAVDLCGLQCYNYSETTALVVVFLSAPFVSRGVTRSAGICDRRPGSVWSGRLNARRWM